MTMLLASADPQTLAAKVTDLIAAGRPQAARPLLAALHRLGAEDDSLAALDARLAQLEGRLDDAAADISRAITFAPENPALRKHRAEIRMQLNNPIGAADDAAEAVILDRADADAKTLLGITLIDINRYDDAIICLDESLAARPGHPASAIALAQAHERLGHTPAALAVLEQAITDNPAHPGLRNARLLALLRQGDCAAAITAATQALDAGAADATSLGLRGHALSSLGWHEDAALSYRAALKLSPEDPYVRYLVAASGALPSAPRAPREYLRAVFDGYAERFDMHLISLHYRVPGLVRAALQELAVLPEDGQFGPVLDLGCGTGMLAVALGDLPLGPWCGVDLAPRMLAIARERGLYTQLAEADIPAFLQASTISWKLILATDVLCYFGDLAELCRDIAAHLGPDGLFIFSVEALGQNVGAPWRLGRLGRYGHDTAYLRATLEAAGLTLCSLAAETLRTELDQPVAGHIGIARLA